MINFRLNGEFFRPPVLTRALKPNAPRPQLRAGFLGIGSRVEAWWVDNTMPPRNWSKYDEPTHSLKRPRVNVARMKIERARRVPDMPVPALLRRQCGPEK